MSSNPIRLHRRLVRAPLLATTATIALLVAVPVVDGMFFAAHAQTRVDVSVEFRNALSPHGSWRRHARWGEVWVPSGVARDWRPYTIGRWAYTNDWGWYWASDDEPFGWIVYHYGRWVLDDDLGWCWVAGDRWGPAWVSWRRGPEYVGWAPLPPDDVVVEVLDQPTYWHFVRPANLVAPSIVSVLIPQPRYVTFFTQTVVVNRTVIVRDDRARFAVNPGIEPSYIAAARKRPLPTFHVRPRVLAGVTENVPGAVAVKAGERVPRQELRETRERVRPAERVPPPRALSQGEEGRLGDNPPRAAREGGRDADRGRMTGEGRDSDRARRGDREDRPRPGTTSGDRQRDQDARDGERDRPGTGAGKSRGTRNAVGAAGARDASAIRNAGATRNVTERGRAPKASGRTASASARARSPTGAARKTVRAANASGRIAAARQAVARSAGTVAPARARGGATRIVPLHRAASAGRTGPPARVTRIAHGRARRMVRHARPAVRDPVRRDGLPAVPLSVARDQAQARRAPDHAVRIVRVQGREAAHRDRVARQPPVPRARL